MKACIVFVLIFLLLTGDAQNVWLVKMDDIEQRLKNGKDTFYIINYWATWCAPCIKELPYFDKLQKSETGKPVKILLISLDFVSQYKKTVIPFVRKRKIRSEVFLLNEKDQQIYIDRISKDWSGALPATVFINKKKGVTRFFEQEFTYGSLMQTYKSLQ